MQQSSWCQWKRRRCKNTKKQQRNTIEKINKLHKKKYRVVVFYYSLKGYETRANEDKNKHQTRNTLWQQRLSPCILTTAAAATTTKLTLSSSSSSRTELWHHNHSTKIQILTSNRHQRLKNNNSSWEAQLISSIATSSSPWW